MSIVTVVKNCATVARTDSRDFFALIKEENKKKIWSVSPIKIEFSKAGVTHNANEIAKIANMMTKWAGEKLETASLKELQNYEDVARNIFLWLKGCRLQITKPLDELKKEFTAIEKEMDSVVTVIKEKQDNLMLLEFNKRQKVIEEYLTEVQEELKKEDIELDLMSILSDFVEQKRKTQCLTDKGLLKKPIKDAIEQKVKEIVEPIKRERELQKLKEQDIQKLTLDLEDIDINANPVLAIEKLDKLLSNVNLAYPNAVSDAITTLNANINLAKTKIERAKIERAKNVDKEILVKVEQINYNSINSKNITFLENALKELRELREKLVHISSIKQLDAIGILVKDRINSLKAEIVHKTQETKKEKTNISKKWQIDISDLEVLASIQVEAPTQQEAKERIVAEFKNLIKDFVELKLIKE